MCDGPFKLMDEVQCDRLMMYHEGNLSNMESQAQQSNQSQLQESVCDIRVGAFLSPPKAASYGFGYPLAAPR